MGNRVDSENGFKPGPDLSGGRPLTHLQRLLAHQYDMVQREDGVGLGSGGYHGTSVREATASEVSAVLNGENHQPIDASFPKTPRLSHGDYARASKRGFSQSAPGPLPFDEDYQAQKRLREERVQAERDRKKQRRTG